MPQGQDTHAGRLVCAGKTDVGLKRQNNEDDFAIHSDKGLVLVADGMGGHSGGETASRIVVEALPSAVERLSETAKPNGAQGWAEVLRTAMLEVSEKIRRAAHPADRLFSMGATVVAALVRDDRAIVANMGDSRAYLLRAGKLDVLTEDHTLVAHLVRGGAISKEQARTHPARNQVTRHAGMADVVEPDVHTIELERGDRLLLCSDGLHGMVEDERIEALLAEADDLGAACAALVAAANNAGGEDNITVVVAEWDGK